MSKENKQTDFADCFISKQAAMQIAHDLQISVDGYHLYNQAVNNYCAEIGSLPEAIVRCKDCKWFNTVGCAIEIVDGLDNPTENDFCSFAERKTDDQT